jgi:chemosensory pili system protein ChpA (sensor histidine kinase/response regulator)
VIILDPHALVRRAVATHGIASPSMTKALELQRVTKTIMVVDDSVTVRKVTTRFLEREGFNVITAKDGVDALQVLQTRTPDLMLLDIEMPRMDGFEVAKNMRTSEEWAGIPIVMITSRTGDKHREHALSIGVNHYLGKPYQEELLLESINDLLGA